MEATARFREDVCDCEKKPRISVLQPNLYRNDSKFVRRMNPQFQMEGIVHDKIQVVDGKECIIKAAVIPKPTVELSEQQLALHSVLMGQVQKFRRYPGLQFGAYPPEGRCLICSLDEHTSWECPYVVEVPNKNAIVGSGADIVCKVCDGLFSRGHCCNQGSGRARLKFCSYCLIFGEHCRKQCPCYLLDPRLKFERREVVFPPGATRLMFEQRVVMFSSAAPSTSIHGCIPLLGAPRSKV